MVGTRARCRGGSSSSSQLPEPPKLEEHDESVAEPEPVKSPKLEEHDESVGVHENLTDSVQKAASELQNLPALKTSVAAADLDKGDDDDDDDSIPLSQRFSLKRKRRKKSDDPREARPVPYAVKGILYGLNSEDQKNVKIQVETKPKKKTQTKRPRTGCRPRTGLGSGNFIISGLGIGDNEFKQRGDDQTAAKDGPSFKDIGGIERVLNELTNDVLFPLCNPEVLKHLGVKPVSGILLHGPPGCGKTKLAHAIANEAGIPFYMMSAPELVSGPLGSSEQNIRMLFSKAYKTAPSIVFIDEIDAIASKRDGSRSTEMEKRIVAQLLTCMGESYKVLCVGAGSTTSVKKTGNVLVIGATNRPDALDPAIRRPGRFDQEIAMGVPDEHARAEILSVLSRNLRLDKDCNFDLAKIAKATPGFVGADLSALADKRTHNTEETNVMWWKQPWEPAEMEGLSISMGDFERAVKLIQPSSTREGFTAIPNVKWEDVGGLDFLRKEFYRYIVSRIKHPKEFEEFGIDLDQGFLLYGPPGCGKTLIAKAVANEAGANFIHIKGPELMNKWVGESESAVRAIFSRARTSSPCILFFDEVDALSPRRGRDSSHVIDRVLTQLLIELDGADKRRGVFVIGATNRPEMMDEAIKRPGRLGKHIYVPLPGPEERGLILKAIARNKPISEDVDLASIACKEAYENLSGADLAAVVDEAAMIALEEKRISCDGHSEMKKWTINKTHFDRAVEKIRPSVSEKQRKYYEKLRVGETSGNLVDSLVSEANDKLGQQHRVNEQIEREERLMMCDMSRLTTTQRLWVERKQQEILEKNGIQ